MGPYVSWFRAVVGRRLGAIVIIHLGVVDVPYSNPAQTKPNGKRQSGTQTTGDVAQWLEDKYEVIQNFADHDMQNITDAIANATAGAMQTFMQRGSMPKAPLAPAMSAIQRDFRQFLDNETIATMGVSGVPTAAALKGVNHRKKSKKGARRPSFIDTGLYQKSFIAWHN